MGNIVLADGPKSQTIKSLKESLKTKDEHAISLEQDLARNSQRMALLENENYKLKLELNNIRDEGNRRDQQLAQIKLVKTFSIIFLIDFLV
jgi:hypothetical protein